MRIAFYPTLKAPDHPVPSGDRQMARLMVSALRDGGHEVSLPCALRSFAKTPEPAVPAALEQACAAEVARLLAYWQGAGRREKPDVWFTYHLYYKAPDLIGPAVSRALRIPYAVAEASHASKRSHDAWAARQAHVEAALAACDVIFCMTPVDKAGLERLPWLTAKLADLPPFIDSGAFPCQARRTHAPPGAEPGGSRSRLVTIAMMRTGSKLQSYRFLAQALALLPPDSWHLDIAGDGPERGEVEAAFSRFSRDAVTFHGLLPQAQIAGLLAQTEIFLWPGFAEAYGLVYLEAQAAGLPVVALDCGGVASTMQRAITGLLVGEPTPAAYAGQVRTLMDDPALARQMGQAAQAFVRAERNLRSATAILDAGLKAARGRQTP